MISGRRRAGPAAMMETLLRILAVFLLVLANGFFVTSEFAIVSVRRMQVASLAEGGVPIDLLLRITAQSVGGLQNGNALGGVRLPQIQVPVAQYQGTCTNPEGQVLIGTTRPFPDAQLRSIYPAFASYRTKMCLAAMTRRPRAVAMPATAPAARPASFDRRPATGRSRAVIIACSIRPRNCPNRRGALLCGGSTTPARSTA